MNQELSQNMQFYNMVKEVVVSNDVQIIVDTQEIKKFETCTDIGASPPKLICPMVTNAPVSLNRNYTTTLFDAENNIMHFYNGYNVIFDCNDVSLKYHINCYNPQNCLESPRHLILNVSHVPYPFAYYNEINSYVCANLKDHELKDTSPYYGFEHLSLTFCHESPFWCALRPLINETQKLFDMSLLDGKSKNQWHVFEFGIPQIMQHDSIFSQSIKVIELIQQMVSFYIIDDLLMKIPKIKFADITRESILSNVNFVDIIVCYQLLCCLNILRLWCNYVSREYNYSKISITSKNGNTYCLNFNTFLSLYINNQLHKSLVGFKTLVYFGLQYKKILKYQGINLFSQSIAFLPSLLYFLLFGLLFPVLFVLFIEFKIPQNDGPHDDDNDDDTSSDVDDMQKIIDSLPPIGDLNHDSLSYLCLCKAEDREVSAMIARGDGAGFDHPQYWHEKSINPVVNE